MYMRLYVILNLYSNIYSMYHFLLWYNMYNMKFIILATFKCMYLYSGISVCQVIYLITHQSLFSPFKISWIHPFSSVSLELVETGVLYST